MGQEVEVAEYLRLLDVLGDAGTVTPTSLVLLDPTLPYEQWEALGKMFASWQDSVQWWIGDWLLFGEGKRPYGETYTQAAEMTGRAVQTLMNYSSTCRRVPQHVRRPAVKFSIHTEVASLNINQQRHWLARVEREHLTREELRDLLREERSAKETGTEPVGAGDVVDAEERSEKPVPSPPESVPAAAMNGVDMVLSAITMIIKHAVPLDERHVSVRREDLDALEAFLA